ncbi:MAG: hypothetical protein HYT65_02845 [Candidatus Yanofskybacteria bacterium]|nr:hypothetical protein [Candidatus Yanofskybacteria bacterium]
MPKYKLIFKKVVREKGDSEVLKRLGAFERIIVAPDKSIAEQIARAMVGEILEHTYGFSLMKEELDNEKFLMYESYEVGLGDVISISETSDKPTMGLDQPIPNYDYIWNRVKDKLNWHWHHGIAVQFYLIEKSHTLQEVTKVDGVITKEDTHSFRREHPLGIVAVHVGEFNSFKESQKFIESLKAAT